MSVNLINERELHDYLKQSIVGYEKPAAISSEKLKSPEYIKKNRDSISDAIVFQWMKAKFRNFLAKSEKSAYFEPVDRIYKGPMWAMLAQLRGEKLFRFNSAKVDFDKLRQLGRARTYLKKIAEKYVDEQAEKNQPKLRLDYLKTDHKIDSMEKVLILYNKMMSRVDFEQGTKGVLKFADGFKMVRLVEKTAFEAEARGMDHCLARDGYYEAYSRTDEFYSLRDRSNEPHVTIQVRDGVVVQANGKGAMPVNGRYHGYLLNFLEKKNLKVSDYACSDMGLVKIGGKSYSIYHLPKNLLIKLEQLDISDYHLNKIPDLRHVEVSGTFDVSNSPVKNLKGCPQAKALSVYDCTSFDENFLKDLPQSVERIDGYSMPIRCLKHLPQNIEKLTVDIYQSEADAKELYDIPYFMLRKIRFEGGNKGFINAYNQALQNGEDFMNFCSRRAIFVAGCARA